MRSIRRHRRLYVCLGLLTVLPFCVSAYGGRDVATAQPILLPVEVLGESGTVVARNIFLEDTQAESVEYLWLRVNGVRSAGQASLQLNNSGWIPIGNQSVVVAEPGKSFGGIGGGFSTLELELRVPKGFLLLGVNTVRFRFDQTDGVASGYRVLALNLLDGQRKQLLPAAAFVEDDPAHWSSPYSDSASLATGRALWHGASLIASSLPNSPRIKAHCADCHTEDGRDLKYFNFSNYSIVTRSRFHGLSTAEGEQIASYIRSLNVPNPGRPWNPPYQPGPGLDDLPVSHWAAGAGIAWVLHDDNDGLSYLLLTSQTGLPSIGMAPGEMRTLVQQLTPEVFRPDGNLSARQVPIALQLPTWSEWLPRVHPKDAWGPAFERSEFALAYAGRETSSRRRKAALRTTMLESTSYKRTDIHTIALAFGRWSQARRNFLRSFANAKTEWTPALTDRVYSTQLWQLVKTWELMQEFDLEGRGSDMYGPGADARMWVNTVPSETAPSATHIPDGTAGVGGSALTNTYFTAAWYELQILLNSGNHHHRDRYPVDWVYVINQFRDLSMRTQRPEPVRLLVAVTKALQSTDPQASPENLRQGWRPEQNVDPRIVVNPAWSPVFSSLPPDVYRAIAASLLKAWLDKNLQYSVAQYLPIGLPPESYSFSTYGDISGGNAWVAAQQFSQAGVPPELIQRLQRWGISLTDRAGRIGYDGGLSFRKTP